MYMVGKYSFELSAVTGPVDGFFFLPSRPLKEIAVHK